jgi:CubicO group peptidase (beta-lactamase class C family)
MRHPAPLTLLAVALLCALSTPAGAQELPVTGRTDPRLQPLDTLMTRFVTENKLPGAALAVAREGKLVYARGFGYADTATRTPVAPDARFRIASISKPFTSVAVLQLVEQGKLRLADTVFDFLDLTQWSDDTLDPRWRAVTILQLLQHTGGWDRSKSFDPMFHSPQICAALKVNAPATPAHIIRFMVRRPLDHDPGTHYAYCNFGYCLLGRVIERVSGQPYADYVRDHVAAPLRLKSMATARTLPEHRAVGEVRYYAGGGHADSVMGKAEKVPWPYGGWCIESMDSHGGWIASAPDLVRFATALERPAHSPLLNFGSIATLFARPPTVGHATPARDVWYGCGWSVRDVGRGRRNSWHGGLLGGTSTILVRRHDGFVWAVLFNAQKTPDGQAPAGKIDGPMHRAIDAVRSWPDGDRFDEFLAPRKG